MFLCIERLEKTLKGDMFSPEELSDIAKFMKIVLPHENPANDVCHSMCCLCLFYIIFTF